MGQDLDFGLLGPLVVRRAGAALDPGRRRQRLLLIRLLLADGRAVAPQTLCEDLWPHQPGRAPGGAMSSLHAHVSKVRAVLEPRQLRRKGTCEVLVTEPLGYALRVPPESRDTVRFERALARAHRLMDQGRPEDVVEEARTALEMWRGPAFADAAHHLFAVNEAARLEELRQTARELRAAALLLRGRIVEALDAAQEMTAEHPLRETGWVLLLRALYLAGRHPEALQRYTDLRRHLAEELGLEPGPALRALHHGILHHDLPPLRPADELSRFGAASVSGGSTGHGPDPLGAGTSGTPEADASAGPAANEPSDAADQSEGSRDPAADAEATTPPPRTRPAQLPRSLPVFAGREAEGAWMSAASGGPNRSGTAAAAPAVVISGAPGVGKTTFAVHHAHRLAPSFPDGQLFVDLCGFHPHAPAVEPGNALHGFLTALGVPAQRIPEDTPGRSTLFRSLLADRQVLVVLDNARDEEQVRPLLPGGASCLTLITSRNRLSGLITTDGARSLALPLPSQAEAHQALERRLGTERVAAEPAATADIIRLCGRLPLAMAVVAARAELAPSFPLHAIVDDLRDTEGLDAFTGSDSTTDVRAVFSWSYRSLDEATARLLRLLALHPGPHITAPAAASLADLPVSRTRRALAGLVGSCLVEQPLPGRYGLHDLLRGYATELVHAHDTAQERHEATLRILDHYLFTAHEANQLLKQDTPPDLDLGAPRPGVTPESLTTVGQATRWLTAEHGVLSGLLHTAVGQGLDDHTTGLAWSLMEHLNRQEFWPEAITALTPALEVARRRNNRLEEGRCLRHLGHIHGYLGHRDQALHHLRRALTIFEELDATGEQARAHYVMACVLFLSGRVQEAVTFSERGLELSRETGEELWLAECLMELAWFHSNLGQLEKSLRYSEEGIALFERLGAPWQLAQAWDILGHTLRMLGRYEESVATYQRSTRAFEELGDHRNAIGSLMRLGDTRLASGDREGARANWVQALESAEERAMSRSAQEVRDRLTALDMDTDPVPAVPERAVALHGHRLPTPRSAQPAA